MVGNDNGDSGEGFARAFGKALRNFLDSTGMTQVEAVKLLGLKDKKSGKPSKSRLNTYLTDSPPMPDAQVLYLACIELKGFNFEHNGHRMNVQVIRRKRQPLPEKPPEQMAFRFNRQINLRTKRAPLRKKERSQ